MGACLSSPKGDDVSASSARTFVGASAKRAGAGDGSAALVDVPLDSPRADKGTPAPNPEAGAVASSTGVEEEAIAVDEVNPFVDCVRGIDGEMLAGMMEAVASVARHDATVSTRVDADEDDEVRSEPDTLPDDEPEVDPEAKTQTVAQRKMFTKASAFSGAAAHRDEFTSVMPRDDPDDDDDDASRDSGDSAGLDHVNADPRETAPVAWYVRSMHAAHKDRSGDARLPAMNLPADAEGDFEALRATPPTEQVMWVGQAGGGASAAALASGSCTS